MDTEVFFNNSPIPREVGSSFTVIPNTFLYFQLKNYVRRFYNTLQNLVTFKKFHHPNQNFLVLPNQPRFPDFYQVFQKAAILRFPQIFQKVSTLHYNLEVKNPPARLTSPRPIVTYLTEPGQFWARKCFFNYR